MIGLDFEISFNGLWFFKMYVKLVSFLVNLGLL